MSIGRRLIDEFSLVQTLVDPLLRTKELLMKNYASLTRSHSNCQLFEHSNLLFNCFTLLESSFASFLPSHVYVTKLMRLNLIN
jgi:hypothetical protein